MFSYRELRCALSNAITACSMDGRTAMRCVKSNHSFEQTDRPSESSSSAWGEPRAAVRPYTLAGICYGTFEQSACWHKLSSCWLLVGKCRTGNWILWLLWSYLLVVITIFVVALTALTVPCGYPDCTHCTMWLPWLHSLYHVVTLTALTHCTMWLPWLHSLYHVVTMTALTVPCGYHDCTHCTMWLPWLHSLYHVVTLTALTVPCGYHDYVWRPSWLHFLVYLTAYFSYLDFA
jgi:hypothetical protein